MVRTSRRSARLEQLKEKVRVRTNLCMLSLLEDDEDDEEDSDDDLHDEMLLINTYLDICLGQKLKRAIQSRYLTRSTYRRYDYRDVDSINKTDITIEPTTR
jgi:hypothetical protein